jgi:adenylosuccinate lyase
MNDRYQTPLAERYASKEMQYIFSPDMKFKTWRKLWIALAETEDFLLHRSRLMSLRHIRMILTMKMLRREKRKYVMMLCRMYMRMVFSVQRLRESFTLVLHHVM